MDMALPKEITDLLTQVQIYAGAAAGGLAGATWMIGGLMRTMGFREEGMRRIKDSVVGLSIVIAGPTVIFLIATALKAFFPTTTVGGI